MFVLINFNDYLGGGETLLLRMAVFLQKQSKPFVVLCSEGGYIHDDLKKNGIVSYFTLDKKAINYFYNRGKQRKAVVEGIANHLPNAEEYSFVTFCMRDLYMVTKLSEQKQNSKVVHLVLHYQDNLYICQSILDKLIKKFTGKEHYSRKQQIQFNNNLFNRLCASDAIIPMSDLMVNFWNKEFNINLSSDNVVALPVYDFPDEKPKSPIYNHRVIFIGRIVDFKIPGLIVMLNFINKHKEYSLTVVGNGDKAAIDAYIHNNSIDTDRINFIGQVDYSHLGEIIRDHSIGYAMGTSLVEICKQGLPAIMALSTPHHQLFKRDICGGIYSDCVRGNVGDNLFAGESEDNQPLLVDTMAELETRYEESASACYEYIKSDYDLTTNINKYFSIIEKAKKTDFSDIKIPKASILRKLALKLF